MSVLPQVLAAVGWSLASLSLDTLTGLAGQAIRMGGDLSYGSSSAIGKLAPMRFPWDAWPAELTLGLLDHPLVWWVPPPV